MPERCRIPCSPHKQLDKVQIAERAERKWGVVTSAQLGDSGLDAAGISRWTRACRLHRIHPGVYAVGHPVLALEGKLAAALLYAGPGAALWGVTAGFWFGFLEGTPRLLHVCTPRHRRSLKNVRVHARRSVKRMWHKGLPVTTPAQALLDIAAQVRFKELRRALAAAEYLKLVTLHDVEAVLGRGRPGSAALRAALDCHRPQLAKSKSRLEEKLIFLCERGSLTQPEVNVWVAGWLVDAVWFEQEVVVELDSRTAHSTARAIENDHQRDLDLRAAGYVVLRYTWRQLTQTPERVLADLRRHLGM
jgi:very-short-patch-repair endonuclease